MAFTEFDSNVSKFFYNSTDVSSYVINIEGLPGAGELVDCTTLNQSGRKFHRSLDNCKFTIDAIWSNEATYGTHTLFGAQRMGTTSIAFHYGPMGTTSTFIKYAGNCFIAPNGFNVTSKVGDMVRARIEIQVDGQVSTGAYA